MTNLRTDLLTREIRVSARPETIFRFLTDPTLMTRWMGQDVQLEPRPGGIYRVAINDAIIASGEFLDVAPNERVRFSFGWEGESNPVPPGSTTVEITLIPDGEFTVVRLVHADLPAEEQEKHGHGWDHYLSRLAAAVEGRDPGPDPFEAQPGTM
jgi:uncharacterized protein YndB with AHSA1/START domain